MQTTLEALIEGGWMHGADMHFWQKIGDYEICLEPLIFDGQLYLAIYDAEKNLMFPKVVLKAGKV